MKPSAFPTRVPTDQCNGVLKEFPFLSTNMRPTFDKMNHAYDLNILVSTFPIAFVSNLVGRYICILYVGTKGQLISE